MRRIIFKSVFCLLLAVSVQNIDAEAAGTPILSAWRCHLAAGASIHCNLAGRPFAAGLNLAGGLRWNQASSARQQQVIDILLAASLVFSFMPSDTGLGLQIKLGDPALGYIAAGFIVLANYGQWKPKLSMEAILFSRVSPAGSFFSTLKLDWHAPAVAGSSVCVPAFVQGLSTDIVFGYAMH